MKKKNLPKKAYGGQTLTLDKGRGGRLRHSLVQQILDESLETGKGGRQKNLKCYFKFFKRGCKQFEIIDRQNILDGKPNEYSLEVEGYTIYFDEWPWGILIYHSLDETGTRKIETFLKNHRFLRSPWIDKKKFGQYAKQLIGQKGRIGLERAHFEPYNDYSGYGLSLQVRGEKTEEIFKKIESTYALHPRTIGIEMCNDDEKLVKFEIMNNGRISFSSGSIDDYQRIIQDYEAFLLKFDNQYDHTQAKKVKIGKIEYLKTGDVVKIKLPSYKTKKIDCSREERNKAIIKMLTTAGGVNGYIGIPIGSDRADIVDLKDRKSLQVSISDDSLFIFSENPSEARSSIRRLYSNVATHIDPDASLSMITLGGESGKGSR